MTAIDDILDEERARVLRLEYEACRAQKYASHTRVMLGQRRQRDAYAVARGLTEGWSEAHARLRAAEREASRLAELEAERDEARSTAATQGWALRSILSAIGPHMRDGLAPWEVVAALASERDEARAALAEMTARCEARPDISREDARGYRDGDCAIRIDNVSAGAYGAAMRIDAALRKHAGEEG